MLEGSTKAEALLTKHLETFTIRSDSILTGHLGLSSVHVEYVSHAKKLCFGHYAKGGNVVPIPPFQSRQYLYRVFSAMFF